MKDEKKELYQGFNRGREEAQGDEMTDAKKDLYRACGCLVWIVVAVVMSVLILFGITIITAMVRGGGF